MSGGPRIVYECPAFRIVLCEAGHVVEVPDSPPADALGVERWREFQMNNKTLKAMRDALVAESDKKRE